MSARFSDAALEWGVHAAHILGWRPAEFWSATPAELAMALSVPQELSHSPSPPSREAIARMMERDKHD
ncbi:MAG: phage tail assembly chaperone [Porphyrobacter sp.]|nr:phage tail assembly chaperone [Porphyrobacter sp.]